MLEQQRPAGVVHTFASDIRDGDTVVVHGERNPFKVIKRTPPSLASQYYSVRTDNGASRTLTTSTRVTIEDPDGRVAARVAEISIRSAAGVGEPVP